MLEREAEVAALEATLDAAHDGGGRLIVVEGGAGIGKTRLLAEARELAAAAEFEVMTARGGELEGEFAFGIIRQLFEAPLAGATPNMRAELLSGAASLSGSLFASAPTTASADGAESSFAMLHSLYWLAANFASHAPTLLVVDDLHWADEPSLRWLAFLARRLEGLPLLVLVGTRPSSDGRPPALIAELRADPDAVVIRLEALGLDSTARLIGDRLAVAPDTAFVEAVQTGSGGNPLYVAAILDSVRREELAPTAKNASRVAILGPRAVAEGVALRLVRLPADAGQLLHAAAILGDHVKLAHAAALAGLDTATALKAASALVQVDLLRRENPLEFIHPVVRSAVLESMAADERVRAHRRAATTLVEAGALPEQAAAHLAQTLPARDPFVVATLRDAARRALALGAPEVAAGYLRRALDEPPRPQERAHVLGELGVVQTHTHASEAADHLRQALAELGEADYPEFAIAYAHSLMMLTEKTKEVVELLDRTTGLAGRGDRHLAERLEGQLLVAAHYDPELYPLAAERWEAMRSHDLPDHAGALLAFGAEEEARRATSRSLAQQLARRSLRSGLEQTPERAYLSKALHTLHLAGDFDEAEEGFVMAIAEAGRRGDLFSLGTFHLYRGMMRTERGDLLLAEEDLVPGEFAEFYDLPTPASVRARLLAEMLLERGEIAEAQAMLAPVEPERLDYGRRALFLFTTGRVALAAGRFEEAVSHLRTAGAQMAAIGVENPAWVPWRSQSALALRQLGRARDAQKLAEDEFAIAQAWGAPRAVGVALRVLGLVENGAAGEQRLADAVDVLAASPARLEHARALIELGAALRRRNSRSAARRPLRDGVNIAHGCGATALARRGNDELAATGARPRPTPRTGLEALTASERRVAQMAAEDLTNNEIAQALFVTVKTVEQHLGRVYRKLDIDSRRQLGTAFAAPAEAATSA